MMLIYFVMLFVAMFIVQITCLVRKPRTIVDALIDSFVMALVAFVVTAGYSELMHWMNGDGICYGL